VPFDFPQASMSLSRTGGQRVPHKGLFCSRWRLKALALRARLPKYPRTLGHDPKIPVIPHECPFPDGAFFRATRFAGFPGRKTFALLPGLFANGVAPENPARQYAD